MADADRSPGGAAELVARTAGAGASFFELRRKSGLGTAPRVDEARACLAAAAGDVLLVNDRVDVALAAGAPGAHVGQDDLPAEAARRLLGPEAWLGLSTHDEAQFAAAAGLPLDYTALGPIFASGTKSGHAEPVGLEVLRRCCAASPRPVVAIGGLDAERARLAIEAGAAGVAVVGALLEGGRVEENVARLLEACGEPAAAPAGRADVWALVGLPGAGKSTVGRRLAELAGRRLADLDELVEREAGASVARVFEREGEEGFRRRETRALFAALAERGPLVLALGAGALESEANRSALLRSRALVAWLEASPGRCARRLEAEGAEVRPLLAAAAGGLEEALVALAARRRPAFEEAAALRVAADGPVEEVAAELRRRLAAAGR